MDTTHSTALGKAMSTNFDTLSMADRNKLAYKIQVKEVLQREFNNIPLEVLRELIRKHLPEYAV